MEHIGKALDGFIKNSKIEERVRSKQSALNMGRCSWR